MRFEEVLPVIRAALKEDMPEGDITSENLIPADSVSSAVFVAKEGGILAGIDVAGWVFHEVDPNVEFRKMIDDGVRIAPNDALAAVRGSSVALLKAERTALNFLQRMSGVATAANRFVEVLKGTRTKVLDTRKTTPGLRVLEKYSVRAGGGTNHRFSLSDMVLIKDNHLRLTGSIKEAVERIRVKVRKGVKIEVETTTLEEVEEALESGVDWIMLDNMELAEISNAVDLVRGRILLEVSGNVDLERAKEIAGLGVDFISVGALTHSYSSLDISLEFKT